MGLARKICHAQSERSESPSLPTFRFSFSDLELSLYKLKNDFKENVAEEAALNAQKVLSYPPCICARGMQRSSTVWSCWHLVCLQCSAVAPARTAGCSQHGALCIGKHLPSLLLTACPSRSALLAGLISVPLGAHDVLGRETAACQLFFLVIYFSSGPAGSFFKP